MLRILVAGILGFGLGVLAGFVVRPRPGVADLAAHWRIVREFHEAVKDPAKWKIDEQVGHACLDYDVDPEMSLHALAHAGEIEYVDIVFPAVPVSRAVNKLWMAFCKEREGIVYATGNPSYTDYATRGVQPLHLQIWFDESARGDVQELIRVLEENHEGTKIHSAAQPQPKRKQ